MSSITEYKAKSVLTQEWVYSITVSFGTIKRKSKNIYFEIDGRWIQVDIKTICRKTPFRDKNGKDIYENDLIGDWNEVDGQMVQSRLHVFFVTSAANGCWITVRSKTNHVLHHCFVNWKILIMK